MKERLRGEVLPHEELSRWSLRRLLVAGDAVAQGLERTKDIRGQRIRVPALLLGEYKGHNVRAAVIIIR